jgi:hypothetical protein
MQQFLAYRSCYSEEAPLILFDKRFCERAPSLTADFSVPQYFEQDLFSVLGSQRPDFRWLIIASARSGSFFHKVQLLVPGRSCKCLIIFRKDPNSTSAWNGTE